MLADLRRRSAHRGSHARQPCRPPAGAISQLPRYVFSVVPDLQPEEFRAKLTRLASGTQRPPPPAAQGVCVAAARAAFSDPAHAAGW